MVLSMVKLERECKNLSCSETTLEMPEDLLLEILHRIPAKFLLRWKAVSKGWKSLIESAHLVDKHLSLRQRLYGAEELKITFEGSNSTGFYAEIFKKSEGLPNRNIESSQLLPQVPGSCNGLVCVYDRINVYIFNPITHVIRRLALPQGTILSVGFGRDVVTGAYKIVVAYSFDDNTRVEIMVFDLSTSKWRRRCKTAGPVPLSFALVNPKRNPVFVNGSLFWLCARDHSEILVMSLHTEEFRTLSQPKDIDVSSSAIYMWSRDDRLCVSDLRELRDSDVWVLVEDEVNTKRWERTRFASDDSAIPTVIPPYKLNSAWFSPTLVSPYQSSMR